ncbi:MAG: PQQ-binding-like beta-propeller repeat protein [Phycisphaera sp. RhM]|nr:PQQ-binding-like beta-propeller repeat protein [Phycisphaera sp. RhM]
MRPTILLCLTASFLWPPVFLTATADDWPMYRHDAGRQGVTHDSLAKELRLAWSRELPPLTPAFNNQRLQFDAGYEPVIARGRLLLASSRTDSVKAYDSNTGKLLWTFYTDGPVRLAPAIWQDLACFGSDDGCFYCVELATGNLRWKQRAVPSERRLLGNKRLISVWPVRGGPVVADGTVYFAAGVWPFEGVFVYAMDIATGDVLWRNDRMGYLFGQQPHNTEAIGGLAPQGYLVINGDELIVPCSTAYPARLNRQTGELIEFELPGPGRYPGGWFAALDPDQARALRRGKLTFDEAINRQQHEDKIHQGRGGVEGLSREIRAGVTTLKFDDGVEGVTGEIHSMAVAENALFVTTRDGRILCFRENGPVAGENPTLWNDTTTALVMPRGAKTTAETIKAVSQNASSQYGVAMVLGLSDGSLTKTLIESSDYHVVVFDDDADRIKRLRGELDEAGLYGTRAAVIHSDLKTMRLPPYVATVLVSERPDVDFEPLLQSLRPFGGIAVGRRVPEQSLRKIEPGHFAIEKPANSSLSVICREGPLPGTTQYSGDWAPSEDALVRFPLGVLWFDDALAHFKRSPQPRFDRGVMISRPKDWHAPRLKGDYKTDYPLLPPVLSDIYTGRVLDDSECTDLRRNLKTTSGAIAEPSQYRPPRQKDAWKPDQPVVGRRKNPLTGEMEPRAFPKTYGCDGGVDYGDLYTLRAGTAAFYDKTVESGTVFLSGPRSGCTNSIIPSGGLLNVPYYYEGCTCSYPLPSALSLVAMPESHEQWSSWGETEIEPGSVQRIGINFGAPGDRVTRDGTLWLDYPAIGGPSPEINVECTGSVGFRYQHSVWMQTSQRYPWVSASMAEGLDRFVIKGLKPGRYLVRLYFAEPDDIAAGQRLLDIDLQGRPVARGYDVVVDAGGMMRGTVKEFSKVEIRNDLTLHLSASTGETIISGIELILQEH